MSHSTRSRPPSHGYWQRLQELSEHDAAPRFEQDLSSEQDLGSGQDLGDSTSPSPGAFSRRGLFQTMSASVALASFSGCRWPVEEIVPFDRRPEHYQPGKIARYATSLNVAGVVRPVLVSSYDGRPIKIEGNPEHPAAAGASDALTQAQILELYDRDRSRRPVHRVDGMTRRTDWQQAEASLPRLLSAGPQTRLAVLSGPNASPTLEKVAGRLLSRFPALRWYEHSAIHGRGEAEALKSIFGRPVTVAHDLEKARVIVDFDADLLVGHPEGVSLVKGFAQGRRPVSGEMNRLYVFEPLPSATGAAADHRFPVSPSQALDVLTVLAVRLRDGGGLRRPEALAGLDASRAERALAEAGSEALKAGLRAVAGDLLAHVGAGVIAIGSRYPAAAHALVQRMNLALGQDLGEAPADEAAGDRGPIRYRPAPDRVVERGTLEALTARLNQGEIDTLLILDGNPVFDAPPELGFKDALAKAANTVHLGLSLNETALASGWHLPMAHGLESWGDAWDHGGRLCAVQPLIQPIFEGRTSTELLSLLADETPRTGYDMVQETFSELHGGAGASSQGGATEKAWRRFLHDGFWQPEGHPEESSQLVGSVAWGQPASDPGGAVSGDGWELDLRPDSRVADGRYANNGWLQELPDAMTKLTWGNAALLGPSLANELGVGHEDVVRIESAQAAVELPVYVLPGMAKRTVSVALGYGRTQVGEVGKGVGVDAYPLQAGADGWSRSTVTLTPLGRKAQLTSTQDEHDIDPLGQAEREQRVDALVREGNLADFEHHPEFAQHMGIHHPPLLSLWEERQGEGHQWGMAIDLNACIACNSCVVACQAENNIPVVGKEEVSKGREMHWIRVDRYFQGDPDTADIAHQPLGCVHCELAPCEQVCPVGATMHSEEGLNVMAYNRCVGTRYCANNCPYKVRRFNFFNYNKDIVDLEKLGKNPEVSVRARGVMEKCSYCVQRIEHARIEAKNEGREMRDGDVVTACQQACPSQAISFGDLSDSESVVSKQHADPRAYSLLAELNTKPRTVYLARIRNPHPDLAPPSTHGSSDHGSSDHGSSGHGSASGHGGHGAAAPDHTTSEGPHGHEQSTEQEGGH